jgi:membrane-associated phospholipid phosphatase
LFFLLALITAYSRVYLSQHFLIDTYFGALIGVAIVIVFHYLIIKSDKTWLDQSIITIFSKNEK